MAKKRTIGLWQYQRYVPVLVYGLSTVLMFLLQTAPRLFPSIWGIRPTLLIPFVVCTAVLSGARVGAGVGVMSGLLWGIYSVRVYGIEAMLLLFLGVAAGLLVEWLLRANFWTALLLSSGASLIAAFLDWLLRFALFGKEQLGTVLIQVFLPNVLYTVVVTPLVYLYCLFFARRLRKIARS